MNLNFRLLLPVSLTAILVSCGPMRHSNRTAAHGSDYLAGLGVTSVSETPRNPAEAASFWDGDSMRGAPSIRINRREQKAYFYKGGQLAGLAPVSTGDVKHPTPLGSFKVTEKRIDHKSSLYGTIVDKASGRVVIEEADTRIHKPGPGQEYVGASMEYFLRFNHGVGMHSGHLPGYAASHGCVRMPRHMAQKFFEHAPLGTPVVVE